MLESLFSKRYSKKTPTQVFPSEICEIFNRTPPVAAFIFCKDFVDISYENSHTHTRRLNVAAAYLFIKYNFILVCGMSFPD